MARTRKTRAQRISEIEIQLEQLKARESTEQRKHEHGDHEQRRASHAGGSMGALAA